MMKRVYFNDVVTRDSFQSEPNFIPTDAVLLEAQTGRETGVFSKSPVV